MRIQVDWSLLIIFAIVAFNLGAGVLPRWHPAWGPVLAWTVALAAATLFFASVLAHELSHALVARAQGVVVSEITLFLFGGLAHMEEEPPSPKSELLIALVGPLTSFLIGAGATVAGMMLSGSPGIGAGAMPVPEAFERMASQLSPTATLLLWLGPINVLLAVFNTVPGFPLDGGRALRALLWWLMGDLTRATRWAAGAGQLVAWLLMAVGVVNAFGGALAQGLWLVLIGWFLNSAARGSYQRVLAKKALENVTVSRIMWTEPTCVLPDLSVDRLVEDHLMRGEQSTFPVQREGDLLGIVTGDDVRRVPRDQWAVTPVARIMTPIADLPELHPGTDADEAMAELARFGADQLPVVEGSRLIGLVRRRDLVRWLTLQNADHAA